MSLRNALKSQQMADDQLEDLALINGMQLDDQLAPNTRYKIVNK